MPIDHQVDLKDFGGFQWFVNIAPLDRPTRFLFKTFRDVMFTDTMMTHKRYKNIRFGANNKEQQYTIL